MKAWCIGFALLIAGCGGGGGNWSKSGADDATVAGEYADCRTLAGGAVETQVNIDQDILATRQADWQRSGTGRVQSETTREHTRDRTAAIVAACMQAKGYSQPR